MRSAGLTVACVSDQRTASHRLPALDGIRAIAIGTVVLWHVMPGHFRGGTLGVDVFFALSGYLITSILLREYEQRRTISLRDFYIRRFLRLGPALIVVTVFTLAVAVAWGYQHPWLD